MSKTIEERLEELLKQSLNAYPWGRRYPSAEFYPNDELAEPKRAITKPWNAAIKAMEFLVNEYYDETTPCAENDHPGWWGCQYCGGEKYSNPELHMPDHCPVAAQQAALAAMKGETDEGS